MLWTASSVSDTPKPNNETIEASFHENATWQRIWRLRITTDVKAHLCFTPRAVTVSLQTVEKDKHLDEGELEIVSLLINQESEQGRRDVSPVDGASIDGRSSF